MAYRLRYTKTAADELNAATSWIAERAPDTAQRWFDGFVDLLATLCDQAEVHGVAPEDEHVEVEIRQIIYRTSSRRANRALYTIRGNEAVILGIRRPGQALLSPKAVRKRLDE